MEAINGVTCIKGEIHSIITFMRLNTRWSQAYRYQTDSQDEGELIHSFRELNEYLEGTFDLHDVDCVTYLTPFLKVITSDKASGPLTSAALSSLCKFVMYGFMSTKFPRMNEGMAIIADCVSQCVFEETDWESDELILMKLLELSTLTYRCDASCLLTVSAAWDIYSTCMSIQNHYRATKILRSEAETTLIHLSLTIYSRAYHILSDPSDGARQFLSQQEVASGKANWDGILVNYNLETPFGITLLLCKIMIILSELIDLHTQPLEGVKFSMQLINVALEAGGLALGAVDPLVDILRNQVCRHLLRASQSENLAIFSLALRVVFNLFMSIKDHMKVQLEVIFSSVHLRLLVNEKSVKPGNSLSPAKEELALESLLEFCREPSLMLDLYTNYDCDVQCTNLFDSVISALCFRSIPHKQKIVSNSNSSLQTLDPVSKVDKLSVINKLALDGLLAIVHSVAVKCLLVDGGRATASDLSTESASVLTGLIQASSQCSSSNSSVGEIDSKEVEDFIDIHKSSKQKKTIHEQNDVSVTTPVKTGFVLDEQVDQWCENDSVDDELYQVSQDQEYDIYSNLVFDSISQSPMASQEKEMEVVKKTGNSNLSKKNSKKMERTIDHTRSSSFTSNSSSGTPNSHLADVVRSESLEERISRAQVLRQRKFMKQKLKLAAEKFNKSPLKPEWIKFAIDLGILEPLSDSDDSPESPKKSRPLVSAKEIATFLKTTPGLGKTQIGEYISKGPPELYPFNAEVLIEYVNTFNFSGENATIDGALRVFLGQFRLPGEAQCIDRLMEAFAGRLFQYVGKGNPFDSADAAFILSFSTIMLNTDLHNQQIPMNKKMTKEQFVRNNRGINEGKDLPKTYLESLYDEIKERQIQVDIDVNDEFGKIVDYTDTATWNKLIHKGTERAPAVFTPTLTARQAFSLPNGKEFCADQAENRSLLSTALYERDMFLAMAKPVLETLIYQWETVIEDRILHRIYQGLWDYATICLNLRLQSNVSSLVQLYSFTAKSLMSNTRNSPSKNPKRNILFFKATYRQWKIDTGHDLSTLVGKDLLELIDGTETNNLDKTENRKHTKLSPWRESSLLKGELLIKIVFFIATNYTHLLSRDAWSSVIMLLLFARSRGVLPEQIAVISDDFKENLNNIELINESLIPSVYARQAFLRAYGHIVSTPKNLLKQSGKVDRVSAKDILSKSELRISQSQANNTVNSSMSNGSNSDGGKGSWMTSIGGLLWSAASNPSELQQNDSLNKLTKLEEQVARLSEKAGHQFMLNTGATEDNKAVVNLFCNSNACIHIAPSGELLRADDELFKISLSRCHPEDLFINVLAKSSDVVVGNVITSLLNILCNIVYYLLREDNPHRPPSATSDTSSKKTKDNTIEDINIANESHFPDHLLSYEFVDDSVNELDAVVVLQWICLIVFASKSSLKLFWPRVHAFLKTVFDDYVESFVEKSPYFLERCTIVVINATIKLIDSNVNGSNNSSANNNPQETDQSHANRADSSKFGTIYSPALSLAPVTSLTPPIIRNSIDSIWWSLRLMRSVPTEVLKNFANHLGSGLLALVRMAHKNAVSMNLEQWYLTFSLLTSASNSPMGRPFVWESLCYLVDNELVNEMNFTPTRHLILRFLQGFSSEEKDPLKEKNMIAHVNVLLPCMMHYTRLTLMAVGMYGQDRNSQDDKKSEIRSKINVGSNMDTSSLPLQANRANLMTYPLPPASLLTISTSKPKPQDCKVLENMEGSNSVLVSERSPRKTPLIAANLTNITVPGIHCSNKEEVEMIWLEAIRTFSDIAFTNNCRVSQRATYCIRTILLAGKMNNLPDSIWVRSVNELVQRLPLSLIAIISRIQSGISMDSSELCLRCSNVIFDFFVMNSNSLKSVKEYQSVWIRFVSILATNASLTGKGQSLHDEMLEMCGALLKLLKPATINYDKIRNLQPKPAADSANGGYFGILNWLGGANPENTTVNTSTEINICDEAELQFLLLSWKTTVAICPSYPDTLKSKNPKLYAEIKNFVELGEKSGGFTHPAAPKATHAPNSRANSAETAPTNDGNISAVTDTTVDKKVEHPNNQLESKESLNESHEPTELVVASIKSPDVNAGEAKKDTKEVKSKGTPLTSKLQIV